MRRFSDDDYHDYLWAKKSDKNGIFQWLPLKQHLIDVNRVIVQLWHHWLSDSQKEIVINSIESKKEEDALCLAQFIAAIHDIGKATPVFQFKKGFNNSLDLDRALKEKLLRNGFEDIDDKPLMNPSESHHALAGQFILEKYHISQSIASIIGAHHGKPVSHKHVIKNQQSYARNYYQEESLKNTSHILWKQMHEEILNWGLQISGFQSANELPTPSLDGQVILSGLLIMADWIGSNEYYFPLQDLDDETVDLSMNRIKIAWPQWKKTDNWQAEKISNIDELYLQRFNFEPRDMQRKFAEIIHSAKQPGMYILEAPMGSGKTEAALAGTELLASKFGLSGIYFGLPTQATSNGIFPRLKDWLAEIVNITHESKSIQLVHGKAALNSDYSKIRHEGKTGEMPEESVIVDEWFSGRKTAMLDDFVVGTIDHFLMMSLRNKHLMLRHLGFARKVVVVDEVHANDEFMNTFLARSLQWLGMYKVPVILMSATLPGSTRRNFVQAYLKGYGDIRLSSEQLQAIEESDNYPMITYTDGPEVYQYTDFNKHSDTKISIKSLTETSLISLINDKLSDGGIIGIIVNTVGKSQSIAKKLMNIFGEDQVELLHSSFIATERAEKEKQLIASIGKNGNRPHAKIIVGTQVIEQSLDIDFDLLISDLAPMDLLIQRVGRLHRHKRDNRPKKMQKPEMYVMGISDEFEFDSGSKAVYGDYLLMRTQEFLPETLSIPSDISPLIQATYSDISMPGIADNDPIYQEALKEYETIKNKKEEKAHHYLLKKTPSMRRRTKETLVGWLKNIQDDQSEEHGIATVRDSNDSIEVVVIQKDQGNYKLLNGTDKLKDKIHHIDTQMEIAQQTIRLPNVLCHIYTIDDTIKELETLRQKYLTEWNDSQWLKGALAIILDENLSCSLNGYHLSYDKRFGLTYEKEE